MTSYQITRLDLHKELIELKEKSFIAKKASLVDFISRRFNLEAYDDALNCLQEFIRPGFDFRFRQIFFKSILS